MVGSVKLFIAACILAMAPVAALPDESRSMATTQPPGLWLVADADAAACSAVADEGIPCRCDASGLHCFGVCKNSVCTPLSSADATSFGAECKAPGDEGHSCDCDSKGKRCFGTCQGGICK